MKELVEQKADLHVDSFTQANNEVMAEKIFVDEYDTHPHFTVAINEVKTFADQEVQT